MKLPSFRELSKEQDKIYNLPLDVNFLISGPPGTGKTVMALYRAEMYRRKKKTPVLLSYSRLLANYTSDAASELSIESFVSTYHSWVYGTYKRYFKTSPPLVRPYVYDWPSIMPRLINAFTNGKPYILIDEGQDLPKDFYLAATLIGENVSVFADENQRITDTQSTFNDIKTYGRIEQEHRLTRNYRNTLQIAQVAALFYAGLPSGKPDMPTREGSRPVIVNTEDFYSAIEFMARFERNNSNLEIGVFVKTKVSLERVLTGLSGKTKKKAEFYRSDNPNLMPEFGKPGIKVIMFSSVKGLEFDVVFIPELQGVGEDVMNIETKMKFYVLLSRAREQLFLLYSGHGEPDIIRQIPKEMVEERNLLK